MQLICAVLVALAAASQVAGAAAPAAAPSTPPSGWVDPNLQTEGFQASLTADAVKTNPLGLVAATMQSDSVPDLPNAGVTFSSQHNAEVSLDADNLWSWEFDGYNSETFGLTEVVNLKDPSWPTVYKLFDTTSSPDLAPIVNGELNKTDLDAIAQGMTDGSGTSLGYKSIWDAINGSALAVISRMGSDPTQAIAGVLGNDNGESVLVGGIGMPVDDTTYIPADGGPDSLGVSPTPTETPAAGSAPSTPTTSPPPPKSAAGRVQGLPAAALAVLAVCMAAAAMA